MRFIVHPELFERFPCPRIPVAVAYGLDNSAEYFAGLPTTYVVRKGRPAIPW